MRNTLVACILSISSIFLFGEEDDSLPNLEQPRYLVFTSGQPTEFGFRKVADMGVKTVINVLPEKECIPGEEATVTAHRMEYQQLPFDPDGLNLETIYAFGDLLSRLDKPLLIHCSTGNHVGGLWFAYRVLVENASLAQALKEGRKIGMKPAMEDAVFEFVIIHRTTAS